MHKSSCDDVDTLFHQQQPPGNYAEDDEYPDNLVHPDGYNVKD